MTGRGDAETMSKNLPHKKLKRAAEVGVPEDDMEMEIIRPRPSTELESGHKQGHLRCGLLIRWSKSHWRRAVAKRVQAMRTPLTKKATDDERERSADEFLGNLVAGIPT